MAEKITVASGTLRNKAEDLRNKNKNFKTKINALNEQEASLNTMWDGEANTKFHDAFAKDAVQMTEFYDLIEKYAQTLDDIAKAYEDAEKKNVTTATKRTYK